MRRGFLGMETLCVLLAFTLLLVLGSGHFLFGQYAKWERSRAVAQAERAGLLNADGKTADQIEYDTAAELIIIGGLLEEESVAWQAVQLSERDGGLPEWDPSTDPLPDHHRRVYEEAVASQKSALGVMNQVADRYDALTRDHWPAGRWFVVKPTGQTMPFDDLLPWLNAQRSLSQALQYRGFLASGDLRVDDALRDARVILGQADAMTSSDYLVTGMVGLGSRRDALDLVEHVVVFLEPDQIGSGAGQVSEPDLRRLIEVLQDDTFVERSLRNSLLGETKMGIGSIDAFLSVSVRERLQSRVERSARVTTGFVRLSLQLILRPFFDLEAARFLRHMLHTATGLTARTGPQWVEAVPLDEDLSIDPTWTRPFPIGSMFVGSWGRAGRAHFETLARQQRAAVALAVRLYQHDHDGAYPTTLDSLVPDYLPSVPRDASATNATVGYDIERRRIWIAGEDGDHDGGVSEKDNPDATVRELAGRFDEVLQLR
ncbi:MAG: hypothetical protein AAF561_16880 [Planctomycetota bacterium]